MSCAGGRILNNVDYWLSKLRKHLIAERLSRTTIRGYVDDGRRFLKFLNQRGVSLRQAVPRDAQAFLDHLRRNYKRRVGHAPLNEIRWRCEFTPSMHALLRLAQRRWPPVSDVERRTEWFRAQLATDSLTPDTLRHYLSAVRAFLNFIEPLAIKPVDVAPQHVDEFLRVTLGVYRRKHGRQPFSSLPEWRRRYLSGIERFLTLIQGQWPPAATLDPDVAAYQGHLASQGILRKTANEYCLHVRLFLDYTREKEARHLVSHRGGLKALL